MRIPLEYGDNFPVPTGSWNPSVPWRFPKQERLQTQRGWLARLLPWVTLGLGMTLGILWMNWHADSAVEEKSAIQPTSTNSSVPVHRPARLRSRLA